jgi:hypothetical protein
VRRGATRRLRLARGVRGHGISSSRPTFHSVTLRDSRSLRTPGALVAVGAIATGVDLGCGTSYTHAAASPIDGAREASSTNRRGEQAPRRPTSWRPLGVDGMAGRKRSRRARRRRRGAHRAATFTTSADTTACNADVDGVVAPWFEPWTRSWRRSPGGQRTKTRSSRAGIMNHEGVVKMRGARPFRSRMAGLSV